MKPSFGILGAVAVMGCGLTEPDRVTANIQGTVVAEATGLAIAGARVDLVDPALEGAGETLATTVTDSEGRYSLTASVKEGCDIGPFFGLYVLVTAPGFTSDLESLVQCEGSFVFDFVMEPSP